MNKYSLTAFILILGFFCWTGASEEQKDAAWEKYISSQKKIQVAFHHLVRLNWPKLRPIVDKSQELQLLLADEKSARYYYLRETHPDRILRDSGFDGFVNFPWTEELGETLKKNDSGYRKLLKKLSKLKKEVYEDPKFQQVEDRLASLQGEREYREIMARFRFVSKEVEELLKFSS